MSPTGLAQEVELDLVAPLGALEQVLEGGCGHFGEERAHLLGDARARRILQAAGVTPSNTADQEQDRFLTPRDAPSVDEQGLTCTGSP